MDKFKRNSREIHKILFIVVLLAIIYYFFKLNTKQAIIFQKEFNVKTTELRNCENLDNAKLGKSSYDEIFKDVFEASKEQLLLNGEYLLSTIKFMIEDRKEDDPKLVEYVRSKIVPPSDKPLNLNDKKRTDFSQIGQSKYIDGLLNQKRKGFFIEVKQLNNSNQQF